jgi:predicted enzyme related to lactoylglutathione lyase
MPNVDKHAPGDFCWMELSTTDQNAAKGFYSAILGWTANDFPMGPDEVYTMFLLSGRTAGAAYTMRAEERSQGVPPHWNLYVCVSSADDTVKKAGQLGAKILAPAFDVMEFGRMAVIQDPTGAVFLIWQPRQHAGVGVVGDPGAFCWADLNTPDRERAKQFYEQLFGWHVEAGQKDPSGYLHIKNGEKFIGGIPPAQHRDPNIPPHWLLYFAVSDVDAASVRAAEMGARAFLPPTSMQGVGRFSVLADPQGAVFALFKPEARG